MINKFLFLITIYFYKLKHEILFFKTFIFLKHIQKSIKQFKISVKNPTKTT